MADRALIHYQPVTGPVWREPVAEKLAWLPKDQPAVRLERRVPSELVWSPFYSLFTAASLQWLPTGQPAKPLERRILGDYAFLPFYSLYNPATLQWIPSGRWPLPPEVRKLGDFQQPPFDALYKPEQLGWYSPAYYFGKPLPRGILDLTIEPIQFAAPAFDPQNLEWIPKGTPPQTLAELRKPSEFAQPAFDALYKPEHLDWWLPGYYSGKAAPRGIPDATVFPVQFFTPAFDPQNLEWIPSGRFPVRALPYTIQSSWIIDPTPRPDVAPPNLHRLYYDISSGRLFILVSNTANPKLIEPL